MIRHLLPRIAALLVLASSALAQQSQAHGGMRSGSTAGGAPEIDVALTGAAIALVVGGILVFTTARRRKLARS
jgi:hypothetical protein